MRTVGYFIAGCVFLLLLTYFGDRRQAFAVSAVTEFLRVDTVSEGADDWSLAAAHICTPKRQTLGAPVEPEKLKDESQAETTTAKDIGITADCDEDLFDQKTFKMDESLDELTLRWTDDYILEIRDFDRDFLYIYIQRLDPEKGKAAQPVFFDGIDIPGDSILYLPVNNQEPLRLALRGDIALGEPPVRSDAMVLREGSYEIRQDGRRSQKHLVASGAFFPGDSVTFEREAMPLWARWFGEVPSDKPERITSRIFVTDLDPNSPGFDVVATTDPQFSGLYLTRVGGQPTRIPVGWAERLLADPFIPAIATILGLMATMLALRNNFFRS